MFAITKKNYFYNNPSHITKQYEIERMKENYGSM